MAIKWYQVAGIAPVVAGLPVQSQSIILDMVNNTFISDTAWPTADMADKGRMYLAAHLAVLAGYGGSGPVTQEAVGALSRQYATLTTLSDTFDMTSYGAMYKFLSASTGAFLGFVP